LTVGINLSENETTMKFDCWYLTDKGLRRESNQDSLLINKDLGLFVVADGMGGHSGGEVASAMAVSVVEEVVQRFAQSKMTARELVMISFEEASRRIFDRTLNESPELLGMGTTMVLAYISNDILYIGNVGDSRCYLFENHNLWQVTEDHSLINEQLRAGVMNEEQVKQLIGRNVITRSVGFEREVAPDIIEREIKAGEIFLLCSDGLSGLVTDQQISEILNNNNPEKAVKECVDQALANGGHDNVTVMIVHFYE
jgi:protein phosphatase